MSAPILAAAAVAVAAAALLVVVTQPRGAWHDAAEHRQAFWVAWDLAATGVGIAGIVVAGLGWAGAGWITFWSVVGSLQPAMITDLRDVRRLVRRDRRVVSAVPPAEPGLRPIRWRAPGLALEPAGRPLAGAGHQRLSA